MSVGTLNVFCLDRIAETTYGTGVSLTAAKRFAVKGNRPKINLETVTDEDALQGTYEYGTTSIPAKKWASANYEMDMRLDSLATYLRGTFGAPSTTGVGPYVHTFTLQQTDNPAFTAFWKDALSASGKLEQFPGCKVVSHTISGTAGGKIVHSVNLMMNGVHTEVTVATPGLSSATEAMIPFGSISVFTIGGVDTKAKLLEFSITFENVYEEGSEFAAGAITLPSLERVGFRVSGSFKLKHDVNGLAGIMADIEAQTASKAIVLTLGSGTYYATFNIFNPAFEVPEVDGQIGKLSTSIPWKGLYSNPDSKACSVVVSNAIAGTGYALT